MRPAARSRANRPSALTPSYDRLFDRLLRAARSSRSRQASRWQSSIRRPRASHGLAGRPARSRAQWCSALGRRSCRRRRQDHALPVRRVRVRGYPGRRPGDRCAHPDRVSDFGQQASNWRGFRKSRSELITAIVHRRQAIRRRPRRAAPRREHVHRLKQRRGRKRLAQITVHAGAAITFSAPRNASAVSATIGMSRLAAASPGCGWSPGCRPSPASAHPSG